MNDFQKIYRQSMNKLPDFSIDASAILDEVRHGKQAARQRRQTFSSAAVTCGLLLLCVIGSAAAFNNRKNAAGQDAAIGDMEAAAPYDAAAKAAAQVPVGELSAGSYEAAAAEAGAVETQEMAEDIGRAADAGAGFTEDTQQMEHAADKALKQSEALMAVEEAAGEFRQYDSLTQFWANETAALALPMIPSGEIEAVTIYVSSNAQQVLFVQSMKDGSKLQISARYKENLPEHNAAADAGGEEVSQRKYTTQAGYTYLLTDRIGETESDSGLQAAITIGDYEVTADFWGYTQEQTLDMIESIDLSVYDGR